MADQNDRFLARLRQLARDPSGFRAVHLHASAYPPALRTRDMLTRLIVALNEFNRKVQPPGEVFLLRGFDIVYLCQGQGTAALNDLAKSLRTELGTFALAGANCYGTGDILTGLNLESDFSRLMAFAEAEAGLKPRSPVQAAAQSVDAALLARLHDALHDADLTSLLFSQAVFRLDAGKVPAPSFYEYYISIQALEDTFCPGVDLTGRRGLFNDLTEALDSAVLRSIAATRPWTKWPISLNLNIAVLDGPAFKTFDAAVGRDANRVILEVNKADVIANVAAYKAVAQTLRGRGYTFCVDALDVATLPHLDLNGLGARLAKLYWNDDAARLDDPAQLAARLSAASGIRWIMAHCDDTAALTLAGKVAVGYVQGKLLDRMVKKGIPV